MLFDRFNPIRAPRWLRAGMLVFALGGCGGGVDSGGTGGAATYANGPITGSGSIIVNGVRFDDSAASVIDDDGGRTKDDLKLGMVVEVRGSAISTDTAGDKNSTASSIAFHSELVGRIDSLDAAVPHASMVVFGQVVEITATTVFDVAGGPAALAPGNVVEVYALYDSTAGSYTATRVERKSSLPSEFRLRGKISSLDTLAKAFNIGGERISYAALTAPAGMANGSIVSVRVNSSGTSGSTWAATRLGNGARAPDDNTHARVEGLISVFTSATNFSVGDVQVNATGITPSGGTPALGVRVEVEGTVSAGVLVASSVSVEADSGKPEQRFVGPISGLNTGAKTFIVKGQTIRYFSAPTTEYQAGTEASLANGANVDVRAVLVNGTDLNATRISFK